VRGDFGGGSELHNRGGIYAFRDWDSKWNADDSKQLLGSGAGSGAAYRERDTVGLDDGEPDGAELWRRDGWIDEPGSDGDGEQCWSDDTSRVEVRIGWRLQLYAEWMRNAACERSDVRVFGDLFPDCARDANRVRDHSIVGCRVHTLCGGIDWDGIAHGAAGGHSRPTVVWICGGRDEQRGVATYGDEWGYRDVGGVIVWNGGAIQRGVGELREQPLSGWELYRPGDL